MRINKLFLFLFITSIIFTQELFATHIVGGTLEYVRLGPGSFPNSSRYKVKLKVFRNDSIGSVGLGNDVLIYVRGDTRFPFNPAIKANGITELNNRFNDLNVFARDFRIRPGSFLDTLTVRNNAVTNQLLSNTNFFTGVGAPRVANTSITGVSTIPGYEYSAFTSLGINYPAAQFMADRNTSGGNSGFGIVRSFKVTDNSRLVDTCTSVVQNSIEIFEYTRVIDLPNIPGGWHMYYEITARNVNVRNIVNPGGTGFALYCRIPDFAALDADPDTYTKLYQAYAAIPGASTIPGFGTVLGLGNAFTFAGLNAGFGLNGGYLNDAIRVNSITGLVKLAQNSSPRFINRPPSFICNTTQNLINLGKNQNKAGNHFSAFDYDGDSLAYEVTPASSVQGPGGTDFPFQGNWESGNATVNGTAFVNTDRLFPTMPFTNLAYPQNVNLATFKSVIYTSFPGSGLISARFPLGLIGTTPGLVIDPKTGDTQFNPPVSARMVASIRVREFRKIDHDGVPGTPMRPAFLGEINTDYQFVVRNCPLPSLAYMESTIGCFKPNSSAVPLNFAPLDVSKDATSSWFWDTGRDRYTITGTNNLALTTSTGVQFSSNEKIERIAPNGSIVTNSTIGGISSPAFYKIGRNTTYSFPGVGSYFVKLVVQLNSDGIGRTTCSDSAYTPVHISELKSGFTVTGGPICIGTPVPFNPFATGLTGSVPGFVTTSGASMYTSLATNPFPKVVKTRRDSFGNPMYTFLGTAMWMQPDGTRDTIAPNASIIAPSKVLYVKYAFGDGVTQVFSRNMSTDTWTATPAVGVPSAITTITGLFGPQSIPGVNYRYSNPGVNVRPYLLVRNQFGCQDSIFRNVTVVSAFPTARIITQSVCQNVSTVTVEGFITTANRGIWSTSSPLPGTFFPSNGATVTGIATVLGIAPSTVAGFYLRTTYLPSASELSFAGSNIPLLLSTTGVSECPVGITTVAGIPVTARPFVDAGPARVLLCRNNLQFALTGTVTGASTTGVWTVLGGSGTFNSTGTRTSTSLGDNFTFASTTVTNVVLRLSATNIGSCNPVADVITLTNDALRPLPVINAANNFTVNGIRNGLSVCANNPVISISGTVTYAGVGGNWKSLSTSPGTGSTIVTTIPGLEAFRVSYVYTPSSAEIATGFVDLQLTTENDVLPSPTNCSNVSRTVRISITESPQLNLIMTNLTRSDPNLVNMCLNNPLVTISGTVVGSGGFNLNIGTGTVTQISSVTGTVLGLNAAIRNFYIGTFTYNPSAAEIASPFATTIGVNLVSTNNANCTPATAAASIRLIPAPKAIITFGGVSLDSIRLCDNNASAFFGTILPNGPIITPVSEFRWFSSGSGNFRPLANGVRTTTYDSSPTDINNGNVRIVLEANNSADRCLATYDTVVVKYFNAPIINPGNNIRLCENLLVGTLTGTISSPASGGIWSTSQDGFFGSIPSARTTTVLSPIYNASINELLNAPVTLTLSTTGANIGTAPGKCLQTAASILLDFSQRPQITFQNPLPIVNENNSIFSITATVSGTANITPSTSAVWGSNLNPNPLAYDPSRINFVYNAVGPILKGSLKYTPAPVEIINGETDLFITVSGANNCAPVVNSVQVNIFSKPTATIFNKGLGVCANNSTINLTASVTGAAGGVWSGGENTITQVAPGFTASYIPSTNEINNGRVKLFFSTTGEFNNANSVRDSITVNISPPPSAKILLTSLSVCGNALSGFFPATITGALGYVWSTSGTGSFFNGGVPVSGSIAGTNINIEYRPSAADKASATPTRLTLITAGNGTCVAAQDKANMYFTPTPVANAGADNTWCLNSPTPIPLNASGAAGSWTSSRPGGTFVSSGNSTSSIFSDSYTPTSVPGLITFTWTTNATSGCPSVSDAVVITVLSSPIITIDQPNVTICGNTTSILLNTTISGGTGVKWTTGAAGGYFTSTSPTNSQIGADRNGTTANDTYVFSAADKAAGFVNLTVSGLGTNPCTTVRSVKRITITPIITGNAGIDQEFCDNISVISLTGNVLANGVVNNATNGIWTVVGTGQGTFSNPNNRISVFTPSLAVKSSPIKRVTLVFLPTIAGTCVATQPSDTVVYTFRTAPSLRITSSPIQVCSDTASITLNATFSGTAGIIWSTTGINTALNWVSSNISTTTSNILAVSSHLVRYIPSASDLLNRSILGFNISSNGSGVCSNVSSPSVFNVTITSKPNVFLGGSSTVCDNLALISLVGTNMTVSGTSRPLVNWYKFNSGVPTSVNFNLPTTITTNNVGTVTTYAPTAADKLNGSVTLFVSITGPNTCKAQNLSKVFTFTPAPTVNIGAASSNLCSNVPSITLTGTAVNSTITGWSLTSTLGGLGAFTGSNGNTAIFLPTALGRVQTTLGFRFTTTLAGCNDVFSDKAIVLTPAPIVTIPNSFGAFCADRNVVTLSGGFSSTNAASVSSSFGGVFSPNNQAFAPIVYQPTSVSIQNAYNNGTLITVTITSLNNGVCAAASTVTSFGFTPPPTISGGSNQLLCASIPTIILSSATGVSGSPSILGYRWSTSANSTITGGSGTFTLTGLTTSTGLSQVYVPGSVEKTGSTVLTIFTTSISGGCNNISAQKIVTYDKAPTFASIPNKTKCSNNAILSFNAVATDYSSIQWSSSSKNQTGGGVFLDEFAISPQYSAGNLDIANKSVTISGTVLGTNACSITPLIQSFVLSITSAPVLTVISPINICSEVSTVQLSAISNQTATGFAWQNMTSSVSGIYSVNQFVGQPVYSITPTDIAAQNISFEVTGSFGNCAPVKSNVDVYIVPKPIINAGNDRVLCGDVTQSLIRLSFAGQNFTQGKWSGGKGNFGSPAIDESYVFPGSTGSPGYVDYRPNALDSLLGKISFQVTSLDHSGLCAAATDIVNVTLVSPPVINPGFGGSFCSSIGVLTLSGSVSGPETYLYQWVGLIGNQGTGSFTGSNNAAGLIKTIVGTGAATDRYTLGIDYEKSFRFGLAVTGTGVCTLKTSPTQDVVFGIQDPALSTFTGGDFQVCADAAEITVTGFTAYSTALGQSLSPFFTATNRNLVPSGSDQYKPSQVPPYFYDGVDGFSSTLKYRVFQSDITAGGVNFRMDVINSTICPAAPATSVVTIVSAPIVSVTGPSTACSNNPVITVVGFSSTNAGTWSTGTSGNNKGFFISQTTVTSGSNTSILGVYSISGFEFENKLVSLIFKSTANGLCKEVATAINIPLKNQPKVDAGVDGTVCNQNAINLTGSIQDPVTVSGTFGWRIFSETALLASTSGFSGAGTISGFAPDTVDGTNFQFVSSNYNPNVASSTVTGVVSFELFANELGCLSVTDVVNYTVSGATIFDAGTLSTTICGSDPLKLNPSPSSEKGVWSTTGLGYFKSGGPGTKTTQIMNDVYVPANGEFGQVAFILSSLPGTNACLIPTPSTVTAFLSDGINVNSGVNQFISICYNYSPVMAGTIIGTNTAKWRSTGTGYFESTLVPGPTSFESALQTSTITSVVTVGGVKTTTGYAFTDVYVPSATDKTSERVIIYLESQNDGKTKCSLFSKDSLTIYFTKAPLADGGGDKSICSTDAIANGITISGLVTMPSPNSSLPGQLPTNAARWQILTTIDGVSSPLSTLPGVFASSFGNPTATTSGLGKFTVTSVVGALNVVFLANDVYYPSVNDTINLPNIGYRKLVLGLVADNVNIPPINTITSSPILCDPIISIKEITFIPPAYAKVTSFTSTGICNDQTELRIKGRFERAAGLTWTTTGLGSITNINSNNTEIAYNLSSTDLDNTLVNTLFFTPIPVGAANGCISPIANVVTVTVNPRPVLTISGSGQTICADNQAITITGVSVNTFTGSWPSAYQWSTNGLGTFVGASAGLITQTGGNLTVPMVYKISTTDVASKAIGFILSHSGPNTCKPKVLNDISLNINPLPVIIPSPGLARCRDNTQIPISVQSIQNVSTVQWVVSRRNVGSAVFTVLGLANNAGTIAGTGFSSSSNGSATGNNLNANAITYFTSAEDRANAAELLFTIYALENDPNTSLPACNQVSASVSVILTDAPVVSITSAVIGSPICSSDISVPLNGTITGFGNLNAIWTTNRFGTFSPSSAITLADLAANSYEYFLDNQDRVFTTLGLTLSVTGTGTCVNSYSSTANITVTSAPELNAGGNDSVCADLKTIPLLNSTQKFADNTFKWITFGTGSFTGVSTIDPSIYTYLPSKIDSANGAVTIALIVTTPGVCDPDTSFKTIRFSTPPKVEAINSGISSLSYCADNSIPISANVDNRASRWVWSAVKNSGGSQQFFTFGNPNANVRGSFVDDAGDVSTNALSGAYLPSREDTLGANRNEAYQLVTLRLSANGIGVCALRTFTSDINVTFTPRPNISLSGINNICSNDLRPITLTAYFFNTVAGVGKWSSSGTNSDNKFSTLVSPNPPTVAGTVYTFDKTDPSTLTFEFKPDNMGTCKSALLQGSGRNVISTRFIPGPTFSPVAISPYCDNIVNISLAGISVNTVVGSVSWFTGGSGTFLPSGNTATGVSALVGTGIQTKTTGQVYVPSLIDKLQEKVSIFVRSVGTTDNCPPDTTKLTLNFDKVPVVTVATDSSSVCAGDVITLSGSIVNHKAGIWKTVANTSGVVGTGTISPFTTTLGTIFYSMSNLDANQSDLKFVLTSLQDNNCTPVSDTATINVFAKPTANAGSPSICTISGIQLTGTSANSSQTVWTTSGKGSFSPSIFASNAIYVPDTSDIRIGQVTLSYTAQGQGPCDETTSSILLKLKANPTPVANAGQDKVVCFRDLYELKVSPLTQGNSYQWFQSTLLGGSNTLVSIAGKNVSTLNVVVDTTFKSYILQVTDDAFGCINRDTIKIKSQILPSLDLDPKACYADELTLSVGNFSKREGTFQWFRNGLPLLNENDPERIEVNMDAGEFAAYSLEYTDDLTECSILDTTVVRPLPILRSRGKVVCKEDIFSVTPVVLTIAGVNINSYTYNWNLGYNRTFNGEYFTPLADTFLMKNAVLSGLSINRDSAKYLVAVTDPDFAPLGCTTFDTVRVKTHPKPIINVSDVTACVGDVVTLDATPDTLITPIKIKYPPGNDSTVFNALFTWNTIAGIGRLDNSQIRVPRIRITTVNGLLGLYTVRFQIGECVRLDTSKVSFSAQPVIDNVPDVPYCFDDRTGVEIDAGSSTSGTLSYLWLESGNIGRKETVYDTTKYFVRISNEVGCSVVDSIVVRPSCNPKVYFPEGLIPDGPNEKDRYFTIFGKYFDNVELTVFNRWGEIVFYSKDKDFIMNNGWDGNFGGTKLPTGVYPYIFKYDGLYQEQKGKRFEERKTITIIR